MANIERMKEKFNQKINERFPRLYMSKTVNSCIETIYAHIEAGSYNIVGDEDSPVGELVISPRDGQIYLWLIEPVLQKEVKAKLNDDEFIIVHGIHKNVMRMAKMAVIIIEFEMN